MTGDTFFHGPGLRTKLKYIANFGRMSYLITEMDSGGPWLWSINSAPRYGGDSRPSRAVNLSSGPPERNTQQHLESRPGKRGCFAKPFTHHSCSAPVVECDLWRIGTTADRRSSTKQTLKELFQVCGRREINFRLAALGLHVMEQ